MSSKSKFGIPGIGPKKEKALIDAGYETVESLVSADFYALCKVGGMGFTTAYRMREFLGVGIGYVDMVPYVGSHDGPVVVGGKTMKPWLVAKKGTFDWQPSDFIKEKRTVWSFEKRGYWASHNPQYRGNWSPYIVRNVLEHYSKPGDLVLDSMVGGGTTPLECLLTGRNSISVDINPGALEVTKDVLDIPEEVLENLPKTSHGLFVGDARNLNLIEDSSIDLIVTHPPYANIIQFTELVDGDLSQINNYEIFFKELAKSIKEFYRVLRDDGCCAILIGDTHRKSHFVPISTRALIEFLKEGFVLKEDVIKREWNCESDRNLGKYANSDFLLTSHEHLFIFKKVPDTKKKGLESSGIKFLMPNSS